MSSYSSNHYYISHVSRTLAHYAQTKSPQNYKKKLTFPNFREEKLQFSAFFSGGVSRGLARSDTLSLKKRKHSFIFLREITDKCPVLPCLNFGGFLVRSRIRACRNYKKKLTFPNFHALFLQKNLLFSKNCCTFALPNKNHQQFNPYNHEKICLYLRHFAHLYGLRRTRIQQVFM